MKQKATTPTTKTSDKSFLKTTYVYIRDANVLVTDIGAFLISRGDAATKSASNYDILCSSQHGLMKILPQRILLEDIILSFLSEAILAIQSSHPFALLMHQFSSY